MKAAHWAPIPVAAALTAAWVLIGWTGAESSDRCDGGVGDGCTVDRRVEIVHFKGHFYGTGKSRKTEWRMYEGSGWRRYVGPRWKFEQTPGAVLVGDLP